MHIAAQQSGEEVDQVVDVVDVDVDADDVDCDGDGDEMANSAHSGSSSQVRRLMRLMVMVDGDG